MRVSGFSSAFLKECSCVVCSSSDQSGILHEVYKSGPQLEEDAVQETEWGVWSQNQRCDKVSLFLSPEWTVCLKAQLPRNKIRLCNFMHMN